MQMILNFSSWMSANLLNLNSSKTEFLIIGLKQQLSKIDSSSLNDVTKHRTVRTGAKYRSWVLVKCVWCGAYY